MHVIVRLYQFICLCGNFITGCLFLIVFWLVFQSDDPFSQSSLLGMLVALIVIIGYITTFTAGLFVVRRYKTGTRVKRGLEITLIIALIASAICDGFIFYHASEILGDLAKQLSRNSYHFFIGTERFAVIAIDLGVILLCIVTTLCEIFTFPVLKLARKSRKQDVQFEFEQGYVRQQKR